MITLSAAREAREIDLGFGVVATVDLSDYDVAIRGARFATLRVVAELIRARVEAGGVGDWGLVPEPGDEEGARALSEALLIREVARRVITGWRGVAEPFTPDLAAELVRRRPDMGDRLLAGVQAEFERETAEGNG